MSDLGKIVDALKQAALEKAKASTGNRIVLDLADDRHRVILYTLLAGKPVAWIEYDAAQLDELMRIFEMVRKEMKE